MYRVVAVIIAALALLPPAVSAGERRLISGDLSGELAPGEYLAGSVITVRRGETLRIRAGTSLYFEQLAGIAVFGELLIEGEPDDPVVLTSVEGAGGAQPFDWNGIEAEGSFAAVRLRHVRIANSVYGVNVKESDAKADLAGVIFRNNGYAPLMIGGQEVPIAAGEPVNILWNMDPVFSRAPAPSAGEASDASGNGSQAKSKKRPAFRAGSIGVTAVGAILCCTNLIHAYNDSSRRDREDDPHESSVLKNSAKRSATMSGVGAAITGAGLACIGISFFF